MGDGLTMREALALVVKVRRETMAVEERAKAAQSALEATPEWVALQEARAAAKAANEGLYNAERGAREMALELFKATGDKNPYPGTSVKMYKKAVYEVPALVDWCFVNAPGYLEPNFKLIERAAIGGHLPTGAPVRIETEPRAQLSGKLEEVLYEVAVE